MYSPFPIHAPLGHSGASGSYTYNRLDEHGPIGEILYVT